MNKMFAAFIASLALVFGVSLAVVNAAPAQAYRTYTRSCFADKSGMWGQVSVRYNPSKYASQRRIVTLNAREYGRQATGLRNVFTTWRLKYVGMRGTNREWGPTRIPGTHVDYNVQRRYTFYVEGRAGIWPFYPNKAQCTVVI